MDDKLTDDVKQDKMEEASDVNTDWPVGATPPRNDHGEHSGMVDRNRKTAVATRRLGKSSFDIIREHKEIDGLDTDEESADGTDDNNDDDDDDDDGKPDLKRKKYVDDSNEAEYSGAYNDEEFLMRELSEEQKWYMFRAMGQMSEEPNFMWPNSPELIGSECFSGVYYDPRISQFAYRSGSPDAPVSRANRAPPLRFSAATRSPDAADRCDAIKTLMENMTLNTAADTTSAAPLSTYGDVDGFIMNVLKPDILYNIRLKEHHEYIEALTKKVSNDEFNLRLLNECLRLKPIPRNICDLQTSATADGVARAEGAAVAERRDYDFDADDRQRIVVKLVELSSIHAGFDAVNEDCKSVLATATIEYTKRLAVVMKKHFDTQPLILDRDIADDDPINNGFREVSVTTGYVFLYFPCRAAGITTNVFRSPRCPQRFKFETPPLGRIRSRFNRETDIYIYTFLNHSDRFLFNVENFFKFTTP